VNTSRSTNTIQNIQEEKIQYDENNAYNEVSAFLQTRINQNFTNAPSPIKHFDPRTSTKSHNLKSKSNNMEKDIIHEPDTVSELNSKSPIWSDNSENIDIGYVRFPPIIPKTGIDNDTTGTFLHFGLLLYLRGPFHFYQIPHEGINVD
jgi:nitrate reductase cytochrome c-type subunit